MAILNRYAVLVRAKTRYVEWANSVSDDGATLTIEALRTNPAIYLLAPVLEDNDEPSPRELLAARATEIFESELARWTEDETLWPENRSPHAFQAWFDAEVIEAVADLSEDVPIESFGDDEAVEHALEHCAWCGGQLEQDEVRLVDYTPLTDVPADLRSMPVELDDDAERIAFAVREEEFEPIGDDEDEGGEEEQARGGEERIADRAHHEEQADEADEDDNAFVLACCCDACRDKLEAALERMEKRYAEED